MANFGSCPMIRNEAESFCGLNQHPVCDSALRLVLLRSDTTLHLRRQMDRSSGWQLQHPGLWLSPLFKGCLGTAQKLGQRAPHFRFPLYQCGDQVDECKLLEWE